MVLYYTIMRLFFKLCCVFFIFASGGQGTLFEKTVPLDPLQKLLINRVLMLRAEEEKNWPVPLWTPGDEEEKKKRACGRT
jgi:hypothetical protein